MTLYTQQEANVRKTWLLFAVFGGVVIGAGFLFAQLYGDASILIVAVFVSAVISIASYWYSDTIVLKMANAEPVSRESAPELYRIVENLAITAGLPVPKIYIIRDASPNAFATGRTPERAVVAVTEGLLKRLDRSELEGVIAHELAHIGNRDMLVSTVAVILVGCIALASDFFLRSLWFRHGRRDRSGLLLLIGIAFAILAPIAATLLRLAISRKREFLADATGALLTRYPEGLARALEKIAGDPREVVGASKAMAHLWISSPFKKRGGSWFSSLFLTHPPAAERIEALRRMG